MAVTLALAKQQCRVDGNEEDTLINAYLAAAKAWVQNYTGQLLERGEIEQIETAFTPYISLHFGPAADNVSISYTDTYGAPQTITDAMLAGSRLYPSNGWPSIADASQIVVSYQCGFNETPADLNAAVLLLTSEFYRNREASAISSATTTAIEALCNPYRWVRI